MRLAEDYRSIIKKAWSIRLIILAGILSGAEVILPFLSSAIPSAIFSTLSFFAVGGAFIARIVAQKDL